MSWLLAHFQVFFRHYGLAALFMFLLAENLGLPVPGELALLFAGYVEGSSGGAGLVSLWCVGVAACVSGQMAGFEIGRRGGGRLQRRFSGSRHISQAHAFFERHGPATILVARFVPGLRVLAGLAAGLYRMRFSVFALYSTLGAVVWVAAVAALGVELGAHWNRLVRLAARLDFVILAVAAVFMILAWRRLRREVP